MYSEYYLSSEYLVANGVSDSPTPQSKGFFKRLSSPM